MVINAAGPWCNKLNDMAGVSLRWTLDPTRVQILYRELPEGMGPIPVTADGSTGIYFRPESRGQQILVGSVLAEDEKRWSTRTTTGAPTPLFRHQDPRASTTDSPNCPTGAGSPASPGSTRSTARTSTSVLGPTELEGWWVANGFSGHGFKWLR